MDYIFEEDVFEVGAEIEAYCSRCKTDTPHTVLTKYEDEIRSVQCSTCSSTHAYRPPRGESEEDSIPEPISVRRRQGLQKLSWEEAMAQLNMANAKLYTPAESFSEGEVLEHPVFGYGYVSDLVSDTKLEAHFRDGQRILVYNRKDISIPLPSKRRSPPPVFAKTLPDKKRKKGAPLPEPAKPLEGNKKAKSRPEKPGKALKPAPEQPLTAAAPIPPAKAKAEKPAKVDAVKPAKPTQGEKQATKPAKATKVAAKPAKPAKAAKAKVAKPAKTKAAKAKPAKAAKPKAAKPDKAKPAKKAGKAGKKSTKPKPRPTKAKPPTSPKKSTPKKSGKKAKSTKQSKRR